MIPGASKVVYLAQVDGQLIEQDQRRLAAEQLPQRLGPGGDVAFVAGADPRVTGLAGKGVSDLAPRRVGQHPVSHAPAVGRIRVLAVEGGNAHAAVREQGRSDEFCDVRNTLQTSGDVSQCNQPVRLAAAVGGVKAENCRRLAPRAGQPPAHVEQQVAETARGVGVGEEAGWVEVFLRPPAGDDLRQIRREVRLSNRSFENIRAGSTGLEDRRNCHCLHCLRVFPVAGKGKRNSRGSIVRKRGY